MTDHQLRVAAVQLTSGADPEKNVNDAIELIERAADDGASYIQLPEYFNYRGPTSNYRAVAESIPGPTTTRVGAIAKRRGVTIHLGSMLETSLDPTKSFNTSVIVAPTGEVVAAYRKGHLFDVNVTNEVVHHESRNIAAGDQLVLVDVGGFTVGLSVCFDLRFPEMYRALSVHGAQVLAVPSSFAVATGKVHWEVLVRARAIENHAYVIAAAQAGVTAEGISSFGHSMIVDPWGEVVALSASDGDDVITATIEEAEVTRRRSQIDVLELRRGDLYRSLADS